MDIEDLYDRVRNFIRDKASLNVLLGSEEIDDDTLEEASLLAITYINSAPPAFVTYGSTVEEFTQEDFLVLGTAIFALQSQAVLLDRNFLNFNDGGIGLILDNKSHFYNQHVARWLDILNMQIRSKKTSTNMNNWLDSTDSRDIGGSGNLFGS